jgi:hypothetical protein
MGAELAIQNSTPGTAILKQFKDEVVAQARLDRGTRWVVMGRVWLSNRDSDEQYMTARLVYQGTVYDEVVLYNEFIHTYCASLLACITTGDADEAVTLECNSYIAEAGAGRIIAFKVEDIKYQQW